MILITIENKNRMGVFEPCKQQMHGRQIRSFRYRLVAHGLAHTIIDKVILDQDAYP